MGKSTKKVAAVLDLAPVSLGELIYASVRRAIDAPLWGGAQCVMTTSRRSRYAERHPEGRVPFFHRTRDTTETERRTECVSQIRLGGGQDQLELSRPQGTSLPPVS